MFIVASDGSFVFERTVILRSKLPRWFKSLKDARSRPMTVHYFSNVRALLFECPCITFPIKKLG